ncbi:hypothetical protein KM1_317410 [Entamoeba histolytica HM-3:IMSS]|uniref:Uncharacterized protein n=2 Tax=Entamoeba histolytica TaxID=5759 RepID=A0A175JX21_ENTHI|nr:hypothetical protein KM1_317410 [Entamoeba histolytica HM-3:IMSS]GAT98301.1 hypothetical protein CL6EHI_c00141 [Entamoeba histolytica]
MSVESEKIILDETQMNNVINLLRSAKGLMEMTSLGNLIKITVLFDEKQYLIQMTENETISVYRLTH